MTLTAISLAQIFGSADASLAVGGRRGTAHVTRANSRGGQRHGDLPSACPRAYIFLQPRSRDETRRRPAAPRLLGLSMVAPLPRELVGVSPELETPGPETLRRRVSVRSCQLVRPETGLLCFAVSKLSGSYTGSRGLGRVPSCSDTPSVFSRRHYERAVCTSSRTTR